LIRVIAAEGSKGEEEGKENAVKGDIGAAPGLSSIQFMALCNCKANVEKENQKQTKARQRHSNQPPIKKSRGG
jgi:hypothetical protein